jgi:hypothetical protein
LGGEPPELDKLVAQELSRPAPDAARHLSDEIRRRYGNAVAAVVFYGSCLRKRTDEGVLDFYVLVDSYREVYRHRSLIWANRLLPPNVFYLEMESPAGRLRSKFAVISTRDFEKATTPAILRTSVWARFCQPAIQVYTRDAAARAALVRASAGSVVTALKLCLPLLPGEGDELRFRVDEFWQNTLHETYAVEMRSEAPETIRSVYLAAPERFDAAARAGLAVLDGAGWLRWRSDGDRSIVTLPAGRRRRAARGWSFRKPLRKAISLISLFKSAATFGDWLPYALWKFERHTGTPIELSDRQRRHPFLWGWPVILRVLFRRDLR